MVLSVRSIFIESLFVFSGLLGCAAVAPQADYQRVAQRVFQATGQAHLYNPECNSSVHKQVEQLLVDGITVKEAVQIGLLNNPELQSTIYEIGIGRAEVVQAGLLSNPFIGVGLQFPEGGGLANLSGSFAQNIAELWQIPYRQKNAHESLDRKILQVAIRAVQLSTDIQDAYYWALAEEKRYSIANENLALVKQLTDLARIRQQAGTGSEIDVNLTRSEQLDVELTVHQAEWSRFESRRRLVIAMGLTLHPDDLRLADDLPEIHAVGFTSDGYEKTVLTHRMDLEAAQHEVQSAYEYWQLQRRRVLSVVEVGVGFERAERGAFHDGDIPFNILKKSIQAGQPTFPDLEQERFEPEFIMGPTLGFELPIFDQNQASIAMAYFAYQQSQKNYQARYVQAIQAARSVYRQLDILTQNLIFYRDQLLPLRETNLQLAREAYKVGKTTILSVIEAQRAVLGARSEYVDLWHRQASAQVELENVANLSLETIVSEVRSIETSLNQPAQKNSGG